MRKIKTRIGFVAVALVLASCATKAPQQTQTAGNNSVNTSGMNQLDKDRIHNSPQLRKEQSAAQTKPVDR